MTESIQSRWWRRLERAPERRAFAVYDGDGKTEWLCLETWHGRAAALVEELGAAGLGRGDVAMLVLPSGALAADATLAVLLAGAVPLLVAPPVLAGSLLDLPRVLEHTARRTRARVLVCSGTMADMRERLEAALPETRLVFDLGRRGGATGGVRPVLPGPEETAAMQLTSGTTGHPRICVWDQRAVLAALDGMTRAMRLSQDDVCLNWTPLYHDMGLVNNFLLCATTGTPLALMSPEAFVKRPALWPRGLADSGATISWSPNFGFALAARRARESELSGVRLDHVRGIWNAAERIHHGSIVEFRERYAGYGLARDAVKTNFGCAENVGGATFSDARGPIVVERVDGDALSAERVARPLAAGDGRVTTVVGVGRPHPGLRVEIVSEEEVGRRLPDGQVGEIVLRTASRMRGYLGDDEATREAFAGDALRTGDLGYLRGEELFWVGRTRERITLRGKKIDPSDLEPVLFEVEGLREGCFAAFGVDDEAQGTQRLVVVSEVREPLARDTREIAEEIRRQLFLRLGLSVGEVLLVRPRSLSKTSSGKRRHRHFRELYLENGLAPYRVEPAS